MADGGRRRRLGLFGSPESVHYALSRPWDEHDWSASDDSVRGGKSYSSMVIITHHEKQQEEKTHSGGDGAADVALFSGHLDITALGGAGFASQRCAGRFNLSGFDAVALELLVPPSAAAANSLTYTLVLKDTAPLPKRPDGREQSSVSWEHDFIVAPADGAVASGDQPLVVVLPFDGFRATYRGKPYDSPEPLDRASIRTVAFMVRSFFGTQQGPFVVKIRSVVAEQRPG
ncbi:NADH:ubiquinone oxidoreductase intermediate-associated protein 30 [Lasiosphaeria miniovina]|uniref:NADH:ubiquinone oxidoreductase intermediate-associated protein 30 n=1 Tax=Lasiosphaeria miniovina TaxID=1954250 RepID=A0AA40A5G8_9PEZI|nr:NADH:ubiquinone oxidoreductase intermediate-associated protein 30 [Lasiosphaeria miniovina]KAK0709622.1 NADH:ubiquinone oxidoreductase intermediate-associated protein 30 [Lasiosphaeria miniovina]